MADSSFETIVWAHIEAIEESPDLYAKKEILANLFEFAVANSDEVQKRPAFHEALSKKADDLIDSFSVTDKDFSTFIQNSMWLIDSYTDKMNTQDQFERAVFCDDVVTVLKLLNDPDVDPTFDNNKALAWASANGFLTVVSELLKKDKVYVTRKAVKYAKQYNHLDILRLFGVAIEA